MPSEQAQRQSAQKLTCLCSPTTHAGSFRCRFHRASDKHWLISHGPPPLPEPRYSSSKLSAKPSCEYHGNENPANDIMKSSVIPKLPLICKPVNDGIPRPYRLRNIVASIGGTKKRYNKGGASTLEGKIEAANNQARYPKLVEPARSLESGIFAVGKCQNAISSRQSETLRPIFSS